MSSQIESKISKIGPKHFKRFQRFCHTQNLGSGALLFASKIARCEVDHEKLNSYETFMRSYRNQAGGTSTSQHCANGHDDKECFQLGHGSLQGGRRNLLRQFKQRSGVA